MLPIFFCGERDQCRELTLMKAIETYLEILDDRHHHFWGSRGFTVDTALLHQRQCRLPLASLGHDTDGRSETCSSVWAGLSGKRVKNMIEINKYVNICGVMDSGG